MSNIFLRSWDLTCIFMEIKQILVCRNTTKIRRITWPTCVSVENISWILMYPSMGYIPGWLHVCMNKFLTHLFKFAKKNENVVNKKGDKCYRYFAKRLDLRCFSKKQITSKFHEWVVRVFHQLLGISNRRFTCIQTLFPNKGSFEIEIIIINRQWCLKSYKMPESIYKF